MVAPCLTCSRFFCEHHVFDLFNVFDMFEIFMKNVMVLWHVFDVLYVFYLFYVFCPSVQSKFPPIVQMSAIQCIGPLQWILKRSALLSFSTILSPNSWKNNRPVFCSLATVASLLSCWVRVQDNCTDMWHSWEGGTDIRHQNTAPIYGTNYMQHSFW